MSSGYVLTPEQEIHAHESQQRQLWGSLGAFLIINNVAIGGRLWATRTSPGTRSRLLAEDVLIILTGIFVNAIIPNLMVATHFGLGLHVYTVNARDPDYPSNLSKTFRHVWITMVLMSSFFLCIKMTLLFFYRRLFIVANPRLRIFWWANFVFIILWFIGATGFYLFQCQPVQYYFMRYYQRFPHKDANNPVVLSGQCDATVVLNVSLPVIFSLISDIGLVILPIWAVSTLQITKAKKRGLWAVFGIGSVACLLELARVLTLNLNTDDADDTSYGVVLFLILTAAEETTAVVCACVPVIAPRILNRLRERPSSRINVYHEKKAKNYGMWSINSSRGNSDDSQHVMPHACRQATETDDNVPLTWVEITGENAIHDTENMEKPTKVVPRPGRSYLPAFLQQDQRRDPSAIYVQTDIQAQVVDSKRAM
ncbi:hypothetical protein F4777DRAFT_594509 [Nemania sp. FL0916]|nr:hypothetical protein F4777DRAFT_594509 [Nemania sp. FL0916]